jgi:hypothetical protein
MQELKENPAFEDDSSLSSSVHEYSTRRANGMLAAAVNAQKDIIFDGARPHDLFVQHRVLRAAPVPVPAIVCTVCS